MPTIPTWLYFHLGWLFNNYAPTGIENRGPSFGNKKSAKQRNKAWAKGRKNH